MADDRHEDGTPKPPAADGAGQPTEDDSTHTSLPDAESPKEIGPYRILQKVGEGGMGEVWEAEQEKPVRRRVALKVIKAGMDTKQVVARFESERQALAMMSHPNIAKVFDAGETARGRPYFAMEFVKGEPITHYCDRHRLTTRARLELFMMVCDGVQHAHHKGIIHRDIKPSNVLVEIQDGKPVPKIIDFGVAKATQQRLTEKTMFTQMGALIGTPEYMSPEQAEMTVLDVDTRTDVYSLGVLLYVLLVGVLPVDSRKLRESGFDEIRRIIREEEPSRPSTRFKTLDGDDTSESARQRHTDPASLQRQLRGDLDWITMKSLEKDRTRRYDSPNELAADLRRHLKHEPVMAGPPSTVYRAGKFIRRHRVGVAVVGIALAVLVGFAVRERLHSAAIARERDRANEAAMTAEQVSEFLVGLFKVSDPSESRGNTITAREILDQGAARIRTELSDQPAVQARLMETIGGVYRSLGLYDEALPLIEESLEKRRDVLGPQHLEVAESLQALAYVLWEKGDYAGAEPLLADAVTIREKALGPDDPMVAESLQRLASTRWSKGDFDAATPLIERSLEIQVRSAGRVSEEVATTLLTLGALHFSLGNYPEAIEVWQETLEIQEQVLHPDHPNLAKTVNNLAVAMNASGRYAEARPLIERSIGIQERVLGPEHPNLASGYNNLADLLREMGDYEAARPLYERAISIQEEAAGPEHPELARFLEDFGLLELRAGETAEARRLFERSLSIREKTLGPDNADTAISLASLAMVAAAEGRYAEAETTLIEALDTLERTIGADHELTARTRRELGLVYMGQGRLAEAEAECEDALKTLEAAVGSEHPLVAYALECLVAVYERMGEAEKAHPIRERAKGIRQRALGVTD